MPSSPRDLDACEPQYADLAQFLQAERPDQVGYRFSVQLAPGGVNPQGFNATEISKRENVEANLDTQTAAGFLAPSATIFYSTPGSPPFNPDGEPRPPSPPRLAQPERPASTPDNTNEPYLDCESHDDLHRPVQTLIAAHRA